MNLVVLESYIIDGDLSSLIHLKYINFGKNGLDIVLPKSLVSLNKKYDKINFSTNRIEYSKKKS